MNRVFRRRDYPDKEKKLRSDVEMEYQLFRQKMLHKTSEEVYENCCRIRFYECVHEYFIYKEEISSEIVNGCYMESSLLQKLWQVYLKYEATEVSSWEEIEIMIEAYIARNKEE